MENTQERLMGYFRGGRVHHAIILGGPQREEKFAIAKNLARFLLCPTKKNGTFCGKCSVCRRIGAEHHPDVLILREEEEDVIKIDTVREITHQMEVSPIEAHSKICIVDECHRMTTASANAFLKTLEEPRPGRYFWLLTTQPGSLLPTIQSRCVSFTFKPESAVEGAAPEATAEAMAQLESFMKTKVAQPLIAALSDKTKALFFLQTLQKGLRDTALAAPPAVFAKMTPAESLAIYADALELEGQLRSNANYGLMLESFLIKNFVQT